MALRDQPYLPLYVQDFLTDEKLMECGAAATGIYIRIMCIMHKSEEYGTILLKQKDKQSDKPLQNFAWKLAKHLPYDLPTIVSGLTELVQEGCLNIDGDFLIQKRMVKDAKVSIKRSESGVKGGLRSKEIAQAKSQAKAKQNGQAKGQANSEYENEYENVIESKNDLGEKREGEGERKEDGPTDGNSRMLVPQMLNLWVTTFPTYTQDKEFDYSALRAIASFIFRNAGNANGFGNPDLETKALNTFQLVADEVAKEPFWVNKPLSSISKNIQEFYNKIKNPVNGREKSVNGSRTTGINEDTLKQKLAAKIAARRQASNQ